MSEIKDLIEKLNISVQNEENFRLALTHSSYSNEHQNNLNNERLEFLGDAALELCMSKYLYNTDSSNEGILTKNRAKTVCEEALNIYASKIQLNKFLLLGNGEELTNGRNRPAIIADAFEAILGAIFIDQGFDYLYDVFMRIVVPYIPLALNALTDYKSILQERIQGGDKRALTYKIILEEGPSHNKTFKSAVYLDQILMGVGKGSTKKESEQQAAKEALSKQAK